jgi:hypothetical protein
MAILTDAELKEMERKYPTIGMSANDATAYYARRDATPAQPTTPAQIFAHYRSLTGDARQDFYSKHSETLWDHYYASQTAAQ